MEEELKKEFEELKIDTKRLMIRRIKEKDKLDLFEIMSDKETAYDDGFTPYAEMSEKYETDFLYLLLDEMHYAIELRECHKTIGIMHLTEKAEKDVMCYEIGYDVNPAYRRKGYASEAIEAIMDYCFNVVNAEILTACVYDWNAKSSNLLKKLGFKKDKNSNETGKHVQLGKANILNFYKER